MKRLLAFALVAGCGGSSVTSLDDYPTQASRAYCERVYACCMASELDPKSSLYPDRPTCESKMKMSFDGQKAQINTSITKGRVVYHGEKVSDCLVAYNNATCTALKSNATFAPPACDTYLEPKVAVGSACTQSWECIDSGCVVPSMATEGTCKPFVAEGGSCATDPCAKGTFCDGTKTCKKLKADNDSCGLNLECSTGGCNGRDMDAGTPGQCGLKGGANSTCFVTIGCAIASHGRPGALSLLGLLVALAALARLRRARRARAGASA